MANVGQLASNLSATSNMLKETISNLPCALSLVVPRALFIILLMIFILQAGCSSAPPPLAIRMYNPKTNQTLHCSATDKTGENTEILGKTVEACARQLEANGFVRDK
jgi:hypothetical protein